MTIVMKFGGTSVGSSEAIQRTSKIICDTQRDWSQLVVVASAMSGVTDLLHEGAATAAAGNANAYREVANNLRRRHFKIVSDLLPASHEGQQLTAELDKFVERYESLCKAVLVLGELTPRALDAMTSIGERMSIRLLAANLRHQGQSAQAIDATELIVTDDSYQNAIPDLEKTKASTETRLRPLLDEGVVAVVTGFVGANEKGITTTLGRGGSDYSAAILGQALEAEEVWIWTDVDGVMTADPRLVPEARTINTLSYREVAELAFYGAKVLHPKTIRCPGLIMVLEKTRQYLKLNEICHQHIVLAFETFQDPSHGKGKIFNLCLILAGAQLLYPLHNLRENLGCFLGLTPT